MAEKQHKRKRQTLRSIDVDPFPAPNHNIDPEAIDTREDRRDKKFRKKKIAAQTEALAFGARRAEAVRFNKTWGRLLQARAIKATNAAVREAEAEEE